MDIREGSGFLSVSVNPSGAMLTFDHGELARGSGEITEIMTGTYLLEAEYPGYSPFSRMINLNSDFDYSLKITLPPLGGILDLSGLPDNTRVFLRKEELAGGEIELIPGRYLLKITRFGFEPISIRIIILPDEKYLLSPDFIPRSFALESLRISRRTLLPGLGDGPGGIKGTFLVSAPGSGTLEIFNSRGEIIDRNTLGPFTRMTQSFFWDGTDETGNKVPDGSYSIKIGFSPSADVTGTHFEIDVDSRAVDWTGSVWCGAPGLLLTPRGETLVRGDFQTGTVILYAPGEEKMSLSAGFCFSPLSNLELTLQGGFTAGTGTVSQASALGLSAKYRLPLNLPVTTSVLVKGAFQKDSTVDLFTNFTGISIALPNEIKSGDPDSFPGSFGYYLCPELHTSTTPITSEDSAEIQDKEFYLRMYARAGFLWRYRLFSAGLSAAVRSEPLTEGIKINGPVETAGELHIRLRETGIFIGGIIKVQFDSSGFRTVSPGLSVSLLD